MNKPLKVLLVLISLILTIVLTGLITAYSIRNIASKYITEEYIREIINSIEYNEIAKLSKDISAFAVFTMCFFALIIGLIIFVPKMIVLIGG